MSKAGPGLRDCGAPPMVDATVATDDAIALDAIAADGADGFGEATGMTAVCSDLPTTGMG